MARGRTERGEYLHPITRSFVTVALVAATIVTAGAYVASAAHMPQNRAVGMQSHSGARCLTRNKAHGTVKISLWGGEFPEQHNIGRSGQYTFAQIQIQQIVMDDLFRLNDRGKPFPMMAREIPTLRNGGVKNGGKTIVLHLKQGLRWSNGAEITSADLKFGWRIEMDEASGPACREGCDIIQSIDTPDRYTAIYHLKVIDPQFVPYLLPAPEPSRWPGAWRDDPHAAALKLIQDPSFTYFLGSVYPTNGPYQVVKVNQGTSIVLQAMKYYAGMVCGAHVKNLTILSYDSEARRLLAATTRQVDVTAGYDPSELAELRRQTSAFKVHVDSGFELENMEFNLDGRYRGKINPLADSNVRLALALALDKYELVRRAAGVSGKTAQRLVAWTFLANRGKVVYPFADRGITGQWDPIARAFVSDTGRGKALADARRLLSQTRWKHGFSLDLYSGDDPGPRVEESVIASSWAKLGVKIKPFFVPFDNLFGPWEQGGILAHGAFQVALYARGTSGDPDGLKYSMQSKYINRRHSTHRGLYLNHSGIHDRLIDQAFDKAAQTFNRQTRARSYAEIQREVNEQAYWIPLFFGPVIWTEDRRVLHVYMSSAPFAGLFWNTYAWEIKGR